MRIGCLQACACVSSCYEFAKQAVVATVIKLDKIRRDPEAFQKACAIALSIIRGINFHGNKNYLPHLVNILDTATTLDFYGFFRFPRLFLYPYTVDRLDEYDILNQLEVILCDNWHLGIPDEKGKNRDSFVRQFTKEQLTHFLDSLVEEDLNFKTEEETKQFLQRWFEKALVGHPRKDFDPDKIYLRDLKIKLNPTSWMETLITSAFVVVDIICVPDFLQGWGLINLSSYAKAIGKIPLFSWVSNHCLGDYIWRISGIGYILQFLKAGYSLWKGGLTPGESKDTKWLMAASLAECVYCFSIVQGRGPKLINSLALIAKSLGLIAFLDVSKPTFFNDG